MSCPAPSMIRRINGCPTLLVDGVPFLLRAGEVRNSSCNSAAYMAQSLWPYVTGLGLNTLLVPVAWEDVEPQEGQFDFTLVDALLQQAEAHQLRLGLLWFGLWKNGQSSYAPQWVKRDTNRFFRTGRLSRRGMKAPLCSISPLCQEAVNCDAAAFAALMGHLREHDPHGTVILVQVENEVGLLGSERDLCPAAQQAYAAPIPFAVAMHFDRAGSWPDAFGDQAAAMFMSWCYATAVGRIAQAGKDAYDLPMYVNAWTIQYPGERPGCYPSGGPVAEYADMWKLMAPAIDWLSPDVYLPDYKAEISKYSRLNQLLFVPEAVWNCKAASQAVYTAGLPHALGYSPYAIEEMGGLKREELTGDAVQAVFASLRPETPTGAGALYATVNRMLAALWPILYPLRNQGRVYSFLQSGHPCEGLSLGEYDALVTYHNRQEDAPDGCGLILEMGANEFLVLGAQCTLEFFPKVGELTDAEFLRVEEMTLCEDQIRPLRTLNGDDQWLSFGRGFRLLHFTLHRRPVKHPV